jgi:hypothetical protein
MSDPETPDFFRTGKDLIERIDELARARGIDPETKHCTGSGNGWIWLLLACRCELTRDRGE